MWPLLLLLLLVVRRAPAHVPAKPSLPIHTWPIAAVWAVATLQWHGSPVLGPLPSMHHGSTHVAMAGQAIGACHRCRCCCGGRGRYLWCRWPCCSCWRHSRLGPVHGTHGGPTRLLLLLLLLLFVGHARLAISHVALLRAEPLLLLLLLRMLPGWG